jgi:uncharacterized protein YndB with AHSA1/START domain
MLDVTKTVTMHAPIERVWKALTEPKSISAWMGGKVQSDPRVGGKYAYFDGETTGQYTLVEAPQRLEYSWRQSSWTSDWSDSIVRWSLRQIGENTEVRLLHEDFPNEEERDGHDEGWDTYWLIPMKRWLEGNS